jgi:hypothetical protein
MIGRPRRVSLLVLFVALFALVGCSRPAEQEPAKETPRETGPDIPESSRALPGIDPSTPELMRTVDPCGLLDKTALAAVGQVVNETGLHFTDCDADITMPDGRVAALGVQLLPRRFEPGLQPLPREGENGVPVYGGEEADNQCRREVVVAEDTVVLLTTSGEGLVGSLCEIGDVAAYAMVPILVRGDVPQVEYDQESLATRDACDLIEQDEASEVPGIDPSQRHAAYAGQHCTWGGETTDNPNLFVTFNRGMPPQPANPAADQTVDIDGFDAVVSPQPRTATDPPGCRVDVEYRALDLPSETRTVEILGVEVSAEADDATNCALAKEFTEKALRRLG